ncbi:MAG: DUF6879 family protein [Egibacteraceae bacterium]
MRYRRISNDPCDGGDCPALFADRHDDRRVIVRGDQLSPTPEIALEDREEAVAVPALHVIAASAELGGELTRVDLQRMFKVFGRDAFRIEARAEYHVPAEAEAIAEFEATGRIILYPGKQDWLDLVAGHAATGRAVQRAHTVHAARLTDYLRWELASQAATNVPTGEDIRIVDLDRHPELAAAEDVWIFDDAVGVKVWQPTLDGADNGIARATDQEMDVYREWRTVAWEVAVPLPEFLESIGKAA